MTNFIQINNIIIDIYYNNVTLRVESSRSGSHMTIIIQNFILISLTFTVTHHPIGLSFQAAVLFLLTYLSPYAFNFLRTQLSTYSTLYTLDFLHTHLFKHLSHYYIYVPIKRTFRLDIYLRLSIC